MDLTKLYCIEKFPADWEKEYEERTGVLASLESLERVAEKKPEKIYMPPKIMAQYRRLLISKGHDAFVPVGPTGFSGGFTFNGIPIEVKR